MVLFAVALLTGHVNAQPVSTLDRQRGKLMLKFTQKDLKENYVDPAFGGIDIDQSFETASLQIDTVSSIESMYAVIANVLLNLHDSHTAFVAPQPLKIAHSDVTLGIIGGNCYVTGVEHGSNAERQGLCAGTTVTAINDRVPSLRELLQFIYFQRCVWPAHTLQLETLGSDGCATTYAISPTITKEWRPIDFLGESRNVAYGKYREALGKRHQADRPQLRILADTLAIWKLPSFDLSMQSLHEVLTKVMGERNLTIDLRGNDGGYVTMLSNLLGYFVWTNTDICTLRGRNGDKILTARPAGVVFQGNISVLIDRQSTSAAEVLARTLQLWHRGRVLGDTSAGMVRKADFFPRKMGATNTISYGSFITTATVTMPDGSTLDGTGVTPDEIVLPTSEDLRCGRDPVLARALQLAGVKANSATAGRLFPGQQKRETDR